MAGKLHTYSVRVEWAGNTGMGTRDHASYSRAHEIQCAGKSPIAGSSDPSFRGDPNRWNPEEMLVASVSTCHQLWYLALCAQRGITVTAYEDTARGIMAEEPDGAGQFTEIVLSPRVTLSTGADVLQAEALHDAAHGMCFIARSVNFPIRHTPTTVVDTGS